MIEIITLCGSTKFKEEFMKTNMDLTMRSKIVLAPGVFGHAEDLIVPPLQKMLLDSLHLKKIDISDAIMVINPGGYIGKSTKAEIKYAKSKGKKIYYLHKDKKGRRKCQKNGKMH